MLASSVRVLAVSSVGVSVPWLRTLPRLLAARGLRVQKRFIFRQEAFCPNNGRIARGVNRENKPTANEQRRQTART